MAMTFEDAARKFMKTWWEDQKTYQKEIKTHKGSKYTKDYFDGLESEIDSGAMTKPTDDTEETPPKKGKK